MITPTTKIQFSDFTHTYLMGDKVLMGVTSLMKKHGLSADYDGIDQRTLDKAAARGTAVHKMLEDFDNGVAVVFSDIMWRWNSDEDYETILTAQELKKIFKWYKALKLPVCYSEFLVSDFECVASSIDKVLVTDEEGVYDLADVKHTYKVHTEALEWQLSIYACLLEKEHGIKVRNLFCIHTRDCKTVPVKRLPNEWVEGLLEAEKGGYIYHIPLTEVAPLEIDMDALVKQEEEVCEIELRMKELNEALKEMRSRVLAYMQANGLKEYGRYSMRNGSIRESIDTKRLKEEMPEVAEKYLKKSEVKPSLIFK